MVEKKGEGLLKEKNLPEGGRSPRRGSSSREGNGGQARGPGALGAFLKRGLDFSLATVGLLALFPLFLILAILIRRETRRPALLRERRIGRGFRPFFLYRFQLPRAEAPLGRFIRWCGLADLPQLLNVIRGEMSLVGPRPERCLIVEARREDFAEILQVRPGMLDPAPVRFREERGFSGKCGEECDASQNLFLFERIGCWKEYARNRSFLRDLSFLGCSFVEALRKCLLRPTGKLLESGIDRMTLCRKGIVIAVQGALVVLSAYIAFLLRFEGEIPSVHIHALLQALPLLVLLRMLGFAPFGLFAGLWRYASIKDYRNIVFSVTLSSTAFGFLVSWRLLGIESFPRSVVVLDGLILIFLLSTIRLTKRVIRSLGRLPPLQRRALIVGAGDAAEALLREMEFHPEHGYCPVGLVDDALHKRGAMIRGVRVLGSRNDLGEVIRVHRPDEIIIAIPSASPEVLQGIVADCRKFGLPVKAIPGLRDLLNTRGICLEKIKDVEPEDLLCRAPVTAVSPELKGFFRGKSVMVTGAGGSIGSELVRQLGRFEPSCLILYERHEHSLYTIDLEMQRTFPNLRCAPVIGDILDSHRLAETLRKHRPVILFHTAAYKHVPLMEINPQEAVRVNVLGTRNLACEAVSAGVERFIFISTDKAVRPASIMGATKRVGELMLQSYNDESATMFVTVRFGNVLESSGSVVPLFKEQIRRGGPVTVTHSDVTRYFMTTAEAVHLVLDAAVIGEGGEIFVLDMGTPVKILDMAKQLISLYGYRPGRDIPIVFTGLRPGEKLNEGLFNPGEDVRMTSHPKIRMAVNGHTPWPGMEKVLFLEEEISNGADQEKIKEMLMSVIG